MTEIDPHAYLDRIAAEQAAYYRTTPTRITQIWDDILKAEETIPYLIDQAPAKEFTS